MGMPKFFRHVAERLVDGWIQEADVILGHADQSGTGWPLTYHRKSHEISV